MEQHDNEKVVNTVIQTAKEHGWSWAEAPENHSAFEIKLPSGRQFGFQILNECAEAHLHCYATEFDLDAYMRSMILDHPDWPVQEVVRDGDFILRKLFRLAEDVQPWSYHPEAHLNRVLMEAEQLGWSVYQSNPGTDCKVVLSRQISQDRCYSVACAPFSICDQIEAAVTGFDRNTVAVRFAALYGKNCLVTGDNIRKEWLDLADSALQALSELDEAIRRIPNDNRSKNLWLRVGTTFRLSAWEYAEVCRQTSLGKQILKRRFETGDCRLDGETYAPGNRGNAGDDEWEHEEFGFDY